MVTVLDHFTRYAFAFPVRSHNAITVAKHLVERVFLVYGVPNQLLLDRGAEFEGSKMTEVCRLLEIDKIKTTPYKPSTKRCFKTGTPHAEYHVGKDRKRKPTRLIFVYLDTAS